MNPLQKQIALAFVRHALSFLSAYLVAHQLATPEQAKDFQESTALYLVQQGALWMPLLISVGWSVLNKYRNHLQLQAVKP